MIRKVSVGQWEYLFLPREVTFPRFTNKYTRGPLASMKVKIYVHKYVMGSKLCETITSCVRIWHDCLMFICDCNKIGTTMARKHRTLKTTAWRISLTFYWTTNFTHSLIYIFLNLEGFCGKDCVYFQQSDSGETLFFRWNDPSDEARYFSDELGRASVLDVPMVLLPMRLNWMSIWN